MSEYHNVVQHWHYLIRTVQHITAMHVDSARCLLPRSCKVRLYEPASWSHVRLLYSASAVKPPITCSCLCP